MLMLVGECGDLLCCSVARHFARSLSN